jgi:hypothetical protein
MSGQSKGTYSASPAGYIDSKKGDIDLEVSAAGTSISLNTTTIMVLFKHRKSYNYKCITDSDHKLW